MKALGFNQLKVHPLSKFWFQYVNLHPYIAKAAPWLDLVRAALHAVPDNVARLRAWREPGSDEELGDFVDFAAGFGETAMDHLDALEDLLRKDWAATGKADHW